MPNSGHILICSLILSCIYTCWLFYNTRLFRRRKSHSGSQTAQLGPSLSVVIPFRNEANSLPTLIASIQAQMNQTNVEFIWSNDHSDDNGKDLILKAFANDSAHRYIDLPPGSEGKKSALKAAIAIARNDFILTWDADIAVSTGFLSVLMNTHWYELSILPLTIQGKGLLGEMQRAEMLALTGLACSTSAQGKPILCNGANLLFSKALYQQYLLMGQGAKISSGDDQFLLAFARQSGASIGYLPLANLAATTRAETDCRRLIHQRVRWWGKMKFVSLPGSRTVSAIIAAGNVSVLLSWLGLLLYGCFYFGFIVGFKMLADGVFVFFVSQQLQQRLNWKWWPMTSLLYPFYLIGVLIAGAVVRPKWKGRVISLHRP